MGPLFTAIDRAQTPEEVLRITTEYLACWTPEMIREIVPGKQGFMPEGCIPFDSKLAAVRIEMPLTVFRLRKGVSLRRTSLEENEAPVPRSLLLLEGFLWLAASRISTLFVLHCVASAARCRFRQTV